MSEIETTRTVKCDICGTVETYRQNEQSAGWGQSLPSLSFYSSVATNLIGGHGPDYCPVCCDAVQQAIDNALMARRKGVRT